MKVSALKKKAEYGIITPEILEEIFSRRLLAADLLKRTEEESTAHAASMVMHTVLSIRKELEDLIQ